MTRILSNLHYSVRSFARTPGATLALLLTIALGFGSSFAVQGFVAGLAEPVASVPPGLVSVFAQDSYRSGGPLSYAEYLSIKARNGEGFEWLGVARVSRRNVALKEDTAKSEPMTVAAITADLANAFGIQGASSESLDGLYRNRPVDRWIPLREESIAESERGIRNCWVIGKLRAGSVQRLDDGFQIVPYTGLTPEAAEGYRRVGVLLRVAAAFVFFIACANVASILIGRSLARSREITLRVALGASRGQLTGALLSDCFVICMLGATLGAVLASWTLRVVPALLFEQDAGSLVFAPNPSALAGTSAAWTLVLLVCGLLPLLVTPYDRPAMVLQRENAGPSKAIARLRSGLVIAQMACCCILAISTGFLLASFQSGVQTNGAKRDAGRTILATVQANPDFGTSRYFRDVERAARSLPFVQGMTWAVRLPGSESARQVFRVDFPSAPARDVVMDRSVFSLSSLGRIRLPPVAGRMFSRADSGRRVAIVNEATAAMLFGGETAGRVIWEPHGLAVEIVGVVASQNTGPAIFYYNDGAVDGSPPNKATFRASAADPLSFVELDANVVSAGYFARMEWPLVAGRQFGVGSDAKKREAIVNQEAADLYFGGSAKAAVGSAVIDETGQRTVVIGVVNSLPLGIFQRRVEPGIYFPMEQDALPRMTVMLDVGTKASEAMLGDVRAAFEAVPGRGPAPLIVKTLETHIGQTALAPLRIATAIIGAFSVIGLLLSVLGLFSALEAASRQRGRELAVRVALGARRRHMILLVLGEGVRLAMAGSMTGILGALLLAKFLPRITPDDSGLALWVWLAGPAALMAAVAVASVCPARGALMADPLRTLQDADGG